MISQECVLQHVPQYQLFITLMDLQENAILIVSSLTLANLNPYIQLMVDAKLIAF